MSYALIRPALFALDAETAHHVTLASLKALQRMGLVGRRAAPVARTPRTVMGLVFPNPVGLAAGLDKNGEYIDALGALGFGFIEVGTVTPRPQPGNPRPRLFRLPQADAVINRMGFNNHGAERLVENVRASSWRGILGVNIGKNFDTPLDSALDDYVTCLRTVYPVAAYVTVNISSPNTRGLRELQASDPLDALLGGIVDTRDALADRHGRRVPLALKIAPDLDDAQIGAIARLVSKHGIDAVVATNTTTARNGVAALAHGNESGGLSGAPLRAQSTRIVRELARTLGGAVPIIGVGGISSGRDACEKIGAGASLVQLYTGLVYRGPPLVGECIEAIDAAALQSAAVTP